MRVFWRQGLTPWAVILLVAPGGCGPVANPSQPKRAEQPAMGVGPAPNSSAEAASRAESPAASDADLAALDAAFRDHIAALKEVEDVLKRMFEDPANKLPPGALAGRGHRAVATHQRLIALVPPPPAQPMLSHEPTPVEAVLKRYHNEMSQLSGRVVFHLKNAAMLSGNDSEMLRKLAAQLEARPRSAPPSTSSPNP